MKKGHFVRYCKIRNFSIPKGVMKWVPNDQTNAKGPKFVRGSNLVA